MIAFDECELDDHEGMDKPQSTEEMSVGAG